MITSTLSKRLRASINCDAVNGNREERAICQSQMHEAAKAIDEKDKRITLLEAALNDAWNGLRYIRRTHGELYGVGFARVDEKCRALLQGQTG